MDENLGQLKMAIFYRGMSSSEQEDQGAGHKVTCEELIRRVPSPHPTQGQEFQSLPLFLPLERLKILDFSAFVPFRNAKVPQ